MALAFVLFQVVVALLAIVVYCHYRNLNYFKERGIPHDPPHFWKGNVVGLRKSRTFHEIFIEYYGKYKNSKVPFVGLYFLQKPTVFVIDLDLAKQILIKDFSNFADKGLFYNERDDPLTAHLFNLDGVKWRTLRHKLSSTFTSGKMKYMFPTVLAVGQEFMVVMHELVKQRQVLEIRDLVGRFTVDVIGTCAFGIQCNSLRDPNAEFLRMGKAALVDRRHPHFVLDFMHSFPNMARRLHMRRMTDHVRQFYSRIVRETVEMREREHIKRNDFMDMLIDMKNKGNGSVEGLTMEEVMAQAFVFFIAGFDTSSSTMGFALYELARHQHVQDKLRAELHDALKRHDQQFTYECMKDLKYFDQVISETLRLYTIVPHLDRKALKRYVVPGHPKFVIEAGQSIIIPSSAIHRDENIYEEPNEFRPERFEAEELSKRESVAFLPFGEGPRNCIGLRFGQMQARIGLALLLKNFKFSFCEQTEETLKFDTRSFLLGMTDGIHLKVEAIQ